MIFVSQEIGDYKRLQYSWHGSLLWMAQEPSIP
ncbi:MAG: hypothetical protein JWQ24_5643 [Tardiphaga sp.]|jgi:hypothetical protein|nr:hypothetical protein [Tardiphaga sp.]